MTALPAPTDVITGSAGLRLGIRDRLQVLFNGRILVEYRLPIDVEKAENGAKVTPRPGLARLTTRWRW